MKVNVVGAGVIGRLLALRLQQEGWKVTLWDRGDERGTLACSYTAAGMLSPFCELETADPMICRLGVASLELWPEILHSLHDEVFYQRKGSLVIAHHSDRNDLDRLRRRASEWKDCYAEVGAEGLRALEPGLDRRFQEGLYFPLEGQIDTRAFLAANTKTLMKIGVKLRWHQQVQVLPQEVRTTTESSRGDWVIDCRGLGGKEGLPDLRGVRGEIIHVEAPEVQLIRPVRLLHPRYPLYIAPRTNGRFVIGASVIESEDLSPMSVRSALELLSAAFSVSTAFGEGRILEMSSNCRPAFPSHLPRVTHQRGLVRVNGLYRHGYLVSPRLAQLVALFLAKGIESDSDSGLFKEAA